MNKTIFGDCRDSMRDLIAQGVKVQMCVTSPPYFGLRDYGHPGQLGLEQTPEEYVAAMVEVFSLVWSLLADDGVLFINLGDSYNAAGRAGHGTRQGFKQGTNRASAGEHDNCRPSVATLKPKDLIGIPWRVAFALQAAGWYLRQDIIWCLSGGTWLYVRTQKGDMPMTVKDLSRLDPATVKLWNGEKWTQLLGMNKSARSGDEVEIVLRSGERISCTPSHRFLTTNGLVNAADLKIGDSLTSCRLPEPEKAKDCAIDTDAAWLAGLYIAEGSRSEDTIQIAGHTKEVERWDRVQKIAAKFGGYSTMSEDGNNQSIRIYGKVLNAVIDELVTGKTSLDKGFSPVVWRYSDSFIAAMVDGYLSGDGHANGNRWRLGFCRNYNLERDLRTACARLGYTLTLNLASVKYDGKNVPSFRGELRKERSGHHNERDRNEIVEIRKSRCRYVYDLGVEDEPHLFALASGVLTHNSKPNPMPESVTDRCTKAHEYLFLLSKSERYYFDHAAIQEPATNAGKVVSLGVKSMSAGQAAGSGVKASGNGLSDTYTVVGSRNRRSVWTIATTPYAGAHFATFPPALIEPCILAGSRTAGKRCDCDQLIASPTGSGAIEDQSAIVGRAGMSRPRRDGEGTRPITRLEQRHHAGEMKSSPHREEMAVICGPAFAHYIRTDASGARPLPEQIRQDFMNRGWITYPAPCACPSYAADVVFDPFMGSGTTAHVSQSLGRRWIGCELNTDYGNLQEDRTRQSCFVFARDGRNA